MNFRHVFPRLLCTGSAIAVFISMSAAWAQQPPDFAHCANVRANLDQGIAACSRIIEAGRTNAHNIMLSYHKRGIGWGLKGDPDRAIADFRRALQIEPTFIPAYTNLGTAFSRKGDFNSAIRNFNEALRLDPNSVIAYVGRGNAYGRQCSHSQALSDFERALQIDHSAVPARTGVGAYYLSNGDAKRAVAEMNLALGIDPTHAPSLALRAIAFVRLQQLGPAMSDAERAVSIDPNLPGAYNSRGIVYAAKNELDKALADFNRAIRLDSNFAGAFVNRGFTFRRKNDLNQALSDYARGIQIAPNCPGAYNNRAYALALKGELRRALPDADNAVRLGPKLATAYVTRGSIHRKMGNLPDAIRDLTEAIRLDPNSPEAFTERALACELQKNTEQARKDFGTALALPGKLTTDPWVHETACRRLAELTASAHETGISGSPQSGRNVRGGPSELAPAEPNGPVTTPVAKRATTQMAAVSQKPLKEVLASCDKEVEGVGVLTLPGAEAPIELNRCYRGPDHLTCTLAALTSEARSISQSYKEIADPKYADIGNIDAVCRIESRVLADHLQKSTSFNTRWELLSAEYNKVADCAGSVEESIRNVVLPDMRRGGDIVKSMLHRIRLALRKVAETQKEVSDLSNEVLSSKKALTTFQGIRASMCSKKDS